MRKFQHIDATVRDCQQRGQPVISVDTKKKELIGDFKNTGAEWQPEGQPEQVRVHDFMIPERRFSEPLWCVRPRSQRRLG